RLLHDVVEPCMLEQREHVSDIAKPVLLACLPDDMKRLRPLAPGDLGLPFAVATVEGQNRGAAAKPQYIAQIVGLVAVERDAGPFMQGGVDIEARRSEIVLRHSLMFLNKAAFSRKSGNSGQ